MRRVELTLTRFAARSSTSPACSPYTISTSGRSPVDWILSAHVVVEDLSPPAGLLAQLRTMLYDRFRIEHVTVQLEPEDFEELRAGGVCP